MCSLQRTVRGALVVAVAFLLMPSLTMAAGTASIPDTTIYNYQFQYGTIERQITTVAPGWPVAFLKNDGPKMTMGAVNCSTRVFFDSSTLQDNDPPYEYERVAHLAVNTRFCTAWKGQGGNSVDTYRGTLAWD